MKTILILFSLCLIGVIYYQAKYYPQIDVNVSSSSDTTSANASASQLKAGSKPKPLRAYSEIVKRPLFSVDRKPPKVENEQVIETIDIGELENLVLFGVVISGETKYAILGNRKENSTEQVKEGHRYKGWQVSTISADSIQFVGKDTQYELFLSPDESERKSGVKKASSPRQRGQFSFPKRKSLFRSVRKKPESPNIVPSRAPNTRSADESTEDSIDEIDPELLEQLGEEGGFEFNLEEEFGEDEFE